VTVVVNNAAGSALSRSVTDDLREALPDIEILEFDPEDGSDLEDALESVEGDVLGISGGDGSINSAAQVALERDKPLLVVPGGTLNHLARDLGLEDVETSIEALKAGDALAMDVSTIDGRVFLNTASFGAYTELVDAREKLEDRIGKWPAMAFALFRVLRHSEPAEVEIDDEPRKIWMIFIGNCRYHPSGFAPTWRERLDDGKLDIRIVNASAPLARTRLIASVLTGRLGRSRIYEQRLAERLKVRSLQGPLRLARDGETFDGPEEFIVEKASEPLTVFAPVKD
jgi:undecaprenyl-diphosphatase